MLETVNQASVRWKIQTQNLLSVAPAVWLLCWIQSLEICWQLPSGDGEVSCRHSQCLSMARHWDHLTWPRTWNASELSTQPCTWASGWEGIKPLWNPKPNSFSKNHMRVYSAPRFNEGYGDIVHAISELRVLWQRQICKLITAGDITGDGSGGYILRGRRGQ